MSRQQAKQRRPPHGHKRSLSSRVFAARAVLLGVGAFVIVFVGTVGLLILDIILSDIGTVSFANTLPADAENNIGLVNPLGWWFFSSHLVEVSGGPLSIDLIELSTSIVGLTFPPLIYRMIPIPILVVTGYIFASHLADLTSLSPAVVGSSISLGYLPMCVLGMFIFSWTATINETEITVSVQLPEAIILAGVIYPVVCGGLGGALAARRDNHPES